MDKVQLKHILIVDDCSEQRLLLKYLLEAKGYTTECTSNGKVALGLLRTTKELPETILLDLNMEIMNGYEFRQLQCADPQLKHIPIVIISGEEDTNSIQEKTQSDVLQKPLNISNLLEMLKRNSRLH